MSICTPQRISMLEIGLCKSLTIERLSAIHQNSRAHRAPIRTTVSERLLGLLMQGSRFDTATLREAWEPASPCHLPGSPGLGLYLPATLRPDLPLAKELEESERLEYSY